LARVPLNTISCNHYYFAVTYSEQIAPARCGDQRDAVIREYRNSNPPHPLQPTCSDFTQSVPGPSQYSFGSWNQDNDYSWAILRDSVVSNLYCIINNLGGTPPVMTSGYRNPAAQLRINRSAPFGRHTFGDAADVDTPNAPDNALYDYLRFLAKDSGACGYACVEPRADSPRHFHVDYRGSCPPLW
jgi:hypothetical protein